MPELPEVQTTVNGLNQKVKGLVISDIWTDLAKSSVNRPDYLESIKYLPFFKKFKKETVGAKILNSERRAKNILINLNNGKTILIHLKMTGHLLFGKYSYDKKSNTWKPDPKDIPLNDPFNRFLHFAITFTNGKTLALSDTRKFAKVTLLSTKDAHTTKHLDNLGPEPLAVDFTYRTFVERLMKRPSYPIKAVLMDQKIISGVGNIYSDEALWLASIHPKSHASKIPTDILKKLFRSALDVLKKGIYFGGDSMSDYRRIDGTPGEFQKKHEAYRRKGLPCRKSKCGGVIMRMVIAGRSAHFCNIHQKLYA